MQRAAVDLRSLPVFVIAHNRLTYLKRLLSWFEAAGVGNVNIIDNASTYPPLLDYLRACPHVVHRMPRNFGHLVLWESGSFDTIISKQSFLLSDCDILPVDECPSDVIDHLFEVLERYPNFTKVGLSLKIDDLPDCYALKSCVLEWERPFWEHSLEPGLYEAAIDTTFAVYRPGIPPSDLRWWRSIRTAPPYAARHLTWYVNTSMPSEEDIFYQTNVREMSSHWSVTDPVLLKDQNTKLRLEVTRLRDELEAFRQGRAAQTSVGSARKFAAAALESVLLLGVARRLKRFVMGNRK